MFFPAHAHATSDGDSDRKIGKRHTTQRNENSWRSQNKGNLMQNHNNTIGGKLRKKKESQGKIDS